PPWEGWQCAGRMLQSFAIRNECELRLGHSCPQVGGGLRTVRQRPVVHPGIRQDVFYRKVVRQAGRLIKFVPRRIFELAQNVPQPALLNAAILSALQYVLAKLGIIRKPDGITIGRSEYIHETCKRHTICLKLRGDPEEDIIVIFCSQIAESAANDIAPDEIV